MAEDEGVESKFVVCFLSLNGKPLTVIGPADAIAMLEERLNEQPDVLLHRVERSPAQGDRTSSNMHRIC